MNKNQKEDSVKEILDIFKGDYHSPVKLWVLAKAYREWAGLILGGIGATFALIFFLYRMTTPIGYNLVESPPQPAIALPLRKIVSFMEMSQRSLSERQEVFEQLMRAMALDEDRALTQESLEYKTKRLSSVASTCNSRRGQIIDAFTQAKNPFEDPKIERAFETLIEDPRSHFKKEVKLLTPQEESELWATLCTVCQNEMKKANIQLVQFLKNPASPHLTDPAQDKRN